MRKVLLSVTAALVAMQFSGCSGYPEDAKGVAMAACKEFKSLNFDALDMYANEEGQKDILRMREGAAKEPKERIESYLAMVNCENVNKTKDYKDGRVKIYLTKFKVKLTKTSGEWKIYDF